MTSQLQHILDLIRQSEQLSNADKAALEKALKEADKAFEITNFKLDRTEKVKHTTAVLLEETIAELEQKRKAVEVQNRELEIEAALEKVRSRALSMHKSEELKEVVTVLFQKLQELEFGIDKGAALVMTYSPESKDHTQWITDATQTYAVPFFIPFTEHSIALDQIHAREKQLEFYSKVYDQHEKNEYFRYLFQHTEYKHVPNDVQELILKSKDFGISIAFEKHSAIAIPSTVGKLVSGDEIIILKRFARVFEQSYTRFLDLQKAEAQAREAQIEAALERVRSTSLAMHTSQDLSRVVYVVFTELIKLDAQLDRCLILTVNPETLGITWYLTGKEGLLSNNGFLVENNPHPSHQAYLEGWKTKRKKWHYLLAGKEKKSCDAYLFSQTQLAQLPDFIKADMAAVESIHLTISSDDFGCLIASSISQLSEAHAGIVDRFTSVFNQTYTRFLDLKKAEAQAREAQIEAALERVRSRTMAMHNSSELIATAEVIFEQLKQLGAESLGVAFAICEPDDIMVKKWTNIGIFSIPYTDEEGEQKMYEAWKNQEELHEEIYEGERIQRYYELFLKFPAFKEGFDKHVANGYTLPSWQKNHAAIFKYGYLLFITTKPFEETSIFIRFAKVFEQTYTRFLDLQKAEAQARESQIQLALERVRAKTMAMQHSGELREIAAAVHDQLLGLGFTSGFCSIVIMDRITGDMTWWMFFPGKEYPESYHMPFCEHPFYLAQLNRWKQGEKYSVIEVSGEEKKSYDKYTFGQTEFKNIPIESQQFMMSFEKIIFSNAYMKHGAFSWGVEPIDDEHASVLQRFASVFEQCYTRFLDLQKAEAQAREAQIEAALEKIRSRSLAMYHSAELRDVIAVFFEKLIELGTLHGTVGIGLYDQRSKDISCWVGNAIQDPQLVVAPFDQAIMMEENFISQSWKAMTEKTEMVNVVYSREQKDRYFKHLFAHNDLVQIPESAREILLKMEKHTVCFIPNHYSSLFVDSWDGKQYSDEDITILRRAGKVFEQAYVRFLDLQKAEAQAREAQIEAALEKVRSTSLVIHRSQELEKVVVVLFDKLKELGVLFDSAFIYLFDKSKRNIVAWVASKSLQAPIQVNMPYDEEIYNNPIIKDLWYAIESGEHGLNKVYKEKDKDDYYRYEAKHNKLIIPESITDFHLQAESWTTSFATEKNSILGFDSWQGQLTTTEDFQLLKRFAKVFEQAYIRFRDLQKAEAQAREAQIEAALERVRSKTMAMHNSNDVGESVATLFDELVNLGLLAAHDRCGIGIMQPNEAMEVWTAAKTEDGKAELTIGLLNMKTHPVLQGAYGGWEAKKESFQYILEGEDKLNYYNAIRNQSYYKIKRDYFSEPLRIVHTDFYFNEGCLYVFSQNEISAESSMVFVRFAHVFGQTYRRYLDLQKAEVQAREAIKQSSIDRVRGEIASMRTTADLDRITPLIWKELTTLGIPFIRCGVFIMDDKENKVHTYLSTPEGQAIAAYHTPMNDSGSLAGAIEHWRQQKVFVTRWVDSDFQLQAEVLLKQGSITSREQYLNTLPKGGFYLHFLPFRQGMLYVGSHEALPSEVLQLVQSLADAFSVAYARYEDFTKLESAKAQIEKTLTDLKQTQTQLIQSEKMASLGELTAGIAHEIQNPLNFVNNFSEVSKELVDEMNEELKVGNQQLAVGNVPLATSHWKTAVDISNDLKQNLEKINHHGKRADGIVKSMLQHSRKSNNQKELTDINALCDEYLRLSYHGLRAKDKSFNAKFEIQCDPELPKLNVLPQDVGRVILNLINNAFYAVSERQKVESETLTESGKPKAESLKSSVDKYEPKVTVTTKYLGDKVEIRVKDNGTGIPAKVKEKIFQPFFTTKPTGQGTGLGLSLSYDIITKGHGGEIKMETKEGEGSEFTIVLPVS